jgi:hypothetical protein
MEDELTAKMHSEFEVDEETDIQHRCISLWKLYGADESDPNFPDDCRRFGLTVEQAMKYKEYCFGLK